MNWFKMLWLNSEERALLKTLKEKTPSIKVEDVVSCPNNGGKSRPYDKIIYSNQAITVVMNDGIVLSKSDIDKKTFLSIKEATSEEFIINLLVEDMTAPVSSVCEVETQEERVLVSSNLEVIEQNTDFTITNQRVYLHGVNLEMPAPVIASFIELLEKMEIYSEDEDYMEILESQYTALKMFWLKLALNPLKQSREDLLLFVRKNNIKITGNGNLVLYRRVVSKGGQNKELITFITQEYFNIKKQKLDPRQFAIRNINSKYSSVEITDDLKNLTGLIGNLQAMYLELPTLEGNDFTAWYDSNASIKLGAIYNIPDTKINLNNGICAAGGLHAASVDYNYSGFGDVPVVVLVNPSKAITVPLYDTGKLRTTEMFVACVNDKPHGVHFDETSLSLFDEEYHDLTLQELDEAAKSKSFASISVQTHVPAVSLVDLNEIRKMLKTRVVNLK